MFNGKGVLEPVLDADFTDDKDLRVGGFVTG